MKIVSARVVHEPGLFGETALECTLENGTVKKVPFYPDEIYLGPEDAVGRTMDDVRRTKGERDRAYLRS